MKITIKSYITMAIFGFVATSISAQSMSKKFKTIKVEMKINAPAERVWEAMVLDYGEISNFSPYIYTSDYINGSVKGVEGATRKCSFNEKGTRWTHERIAEIDKINMTMRNVVIEAQKFPLNMDNSQAFYTVRDNGDGTCTAGYEFQYRTKPAFMGGLVKGQFKKQLGGTLVGLKHYIETGEVVRAGNGKYDEIKNNYPKATAIKIKS
ncbi:SRPBCC family protein [Spongiimicrobium sp. 2-473A-2-J]|uniref:SRPBCC family protein n=1 Tax=Eudoraea algarum TaxID=3417568 RepID=UPI003D36F96C